MDKPHESNVDPTLLELFRAELDTHIPALNGGLLALERGSAEDRDIAAMMRAAHSIKGAARIVGMDAAVRLAHAMEDCFTAAKEKRITLTSAVVDTLLHGVDSLQRLCTLPPEAESSPDWLDALIEQIATVRDGRSTTPGPAPSPPTTESSPIPEQRLKLPACLDDAAVVRLRSQLCEAFGRGTLRICLDFTLVDRISAGGLAVLASLVREHAGPAASPVLVADGIAEPVASLMRVSGLDRAWSASV